MQAQVATTTMETVGSRLVKMSSLEAVPHLLSDDGALGLLAVLEGVIDDEEAAEALARELPPNRRRREAALLGGAPVFDVGGVVGDAPAELLHEPADRARVGVGVVRGVGDEGVEALGPVQNRVRERAPYGGGLRVPRGHGRERQRGRRERPLEERDEAREVPRDRRVLRRGALDPRAEA